MNSVAYLVRILYCKTSPGVPIFHMVKVKRIFGKSAMMKICLFYGGGCVGDEN
jgi:hypothetical protein